MFKLFSLLAGPTNSDAARAEAPDSLRANFGTDNTRNACHGSDAPETAKQVTHPFSGRFRKVIWREMWTGARAYKSARGFT